MSATRSKRPEILALEALLDLGALKASLCMVTGAKDCAALDVLDAGGYHQVYLARMDDENEVIARVSINNSDHLSLARKMRSEVATMQWIRANTDIPVPAVLFACTNPVNPVGAAYMIMQKLPGHALGKVWDEISQTQKDTIIAQLARFNVTLMKSGSFKQIGSMVPTNGGISIGPLIPSPISWFFRRDPTLDNGPWNSEQEYLLACVSRELQWIATHQDKLAAVWANDATNPGEDTTVADYTTLLQRLQAEIPRLEGLDDSYGQLGPFVIRHPDLSLGNILVRDDDPTVITGIIDWEGSYTAPLWAMTPVPQFLHDYGDLFQGDPALVISAAKCREVFLKTCYDELPGVFETIHKAGRKLSRIEKVAQFVTTIVSLENIQESITDILDRN
ncbi:hypothetical protein HGRIS_000575 [Hohenbuehelia grisea]|uniref:Aminoglycoside phosphotransferase domain-containing protein n=1 Tax=Hohenbuehelia grisea TaxID=104357 RepID=A0ABR3JT17_9AGAR